jgi:hypothetical protein
VVIEDFKKAGIAGRQNAGQAETQPLCDICGTKVKRSLEASKFVPNCQTGTFKLHNIWES